MSLIKDLKQFFDSQIDSFLTENPHLELQMLEEQLQQQEQDIKKLLLDLQVKENSTEAEIVKTGTEIKSWHSRADKARAANRSDLAEGATSRINSLLRQGNQLWGKMQAIKEQKIRAEELLKIVQSKRLEVKQAAIAKQAERVKNKVANASIPSGWDTDKDSNSADPLEAQFQKWEADEEIQRLKQNLK
jgi:uncharacterized protein (TIGR04376 family)